MSGLTPDPKTHTEAVGFLSPTFLLGPNGERYMYTMALQFDALEDASSYAVRERYPATCSDDALPYLQQDRQIDRGPNEPRASFEERLRAWLDLWRTAGGAPAVLRALTSYFLPSTTTIETVNDTTADNLTAWDVSVAGSDPPTHYLESPGNWNWDGVATPGRAWVIAYNGPWLQTPAWGDGHAWGDGTCWGFDGDEDVALTLRGLVAKWEAAGCSVPWIIIAFDATWFVPTLPSGDAKLPDGTWGTWGTVTVDGSGRRVYTPSRTSTAIYISGVP